MGITGGLPVTPTQCTTVIAFTLLVGSLVDKFKSDPGFTAGNTNLVLFIALPFNSFGFNSTWFNCHCGGAL